MKKSTNAGVSTVRLLKSANSGKAKAHPKKSKKKAPKIKNFKLDDDVQILSNQANAANSKKVTVPPKKVMKEASKIQTKKEIQILDSDDEAPSSRQLKSAKSEEVKVQPKKKTPKKSPTVKMPIYDVVEIPPSRQLKSASSEEIKVQPKKVKTPKIKKSDIQVLPKHQLKTASSEEAKKTPKKKAPKIKKSNDVQVLPNHQLKTATPEVQKKKMKSPYDEKTESSWERQMKTSNLEHPNFQSTPNEAHKMKKPTYEETGVPNKAYKTKKPTYEETDVPKAHILKTKKADVPPKRQQSFKVDPQKEEQAKVQKGKGRYSDVETPVTSRKRKSDISTDNLKRISDGVLQLNFMRKSFNKIASGEKKDKKQIHSKLYTTAEQGDVEAIPNLDGVIYEDRFTKLEVLRYGRFSYHGQNSEVESLMKMYNNNGYRTNKQEEQEVSVQYSQE